MYRKSSLCPTKNYTAKDFNVIEALRELQADQKRHVEFTSRQALLSEERHTDLMQKITLLTEKVETLVNVVTLQPYGGLTDQSITNMDFSSFSEPSFV